MVSTITQFWWVHRGVPTSPRFCASPENDGQSRPCRASWTAPAAQRRSVCSRRAGPARAGGCCPVVRESNGRLRDWVLVDGRTEVRAEPAWSPMKFEARQAEVALDRAEPPACARPSIEPRRPEDHPILTIEPPRSSNGEHSCSPGSKPTSSRGWTRRSACGWQ